MKYLSLLLVFMTSACVVAETTPQLRPDSFQTTQNTQPLMESSNAIDYSYYAKSDFVNLTIPEDFQYINTTKLKYLMSTNGFRQSAERYYEILQNNYTRTRRC
jgi:hypothetical protein